MHYKNSTSSKGFTLVEIVIGLSIFAIICLSVYDTYSSIFKLVYSSRAKISAIDLSNEELEIVRNLPYADVGEIGGIPSGKLPHSQIVTRGGSPFTVTITVRNIDDPFDGTIGGTPNDLSPADYKVVEIDITCTQCEKFTPISVTTKVSPKNLETASTNGALFIKVFDANGNPVQNANVHITNNQPSPAIVIDDVTNSSGMLQIVDAPPGVNAYNITVTKNGYSTDQTYAPSVGNPNPSKPPATVLIQQVTQISFSIDKISTIIANSVTELCAPVTFVSFNLTGSKIIGAPNVLKYDHHFDTDVNGFVNISNLEWDSYTINFNDIQNDLIGVIPLSPVNLLPNSSQSLLLVVAPKNPDTLLVTVEDSATSLPLSGVSVTLSKSGFTPQTQITGQGFITQTDWSGGSGQATSSNITKYFSSDGNISDNSMPGDVVLKQISGEYAPSGVLTSSSFNTGSPTNFLKLTWLPTDEPLAAGSPSVQFQIATNNDGSTWNYLGPDGTAGTYYTIGNQNISAVNNGNQYLRYKLFLSSLSTSTTPNVSDVSFTYTSQCTPPGQIYFNGLGSATYSLHLSKAGYVDQDVQVNVSSNWQKQTIIMLPS